MRGALVVGIRKLSQSLESGAGCERLAGTVLQDLEYRAEGYAAPHRSGYRRSCLWEPCRMRRDPDDARGFE